jgi:hypothetical protein
MDVRLFRFIIGDWKNTCDQCSDAISRCWKLAKAENDLETSVIFTGRANTVLMPMLKHCQYKWKASGSDDYIPTRKVLLEKGEQIVLDLCDILRAIYCG